MFIARGIPDDTVFKPHSSHEILGAQWLDLSNLKTEKFRCVHPFLPQLDSWIERWQSSTPTSYAAVVGSKKVLVVPSPKSSRKMKAKKGRAPIVVTSTPSASSISDLFDATMFSSGKRWSAEVLSYFLFH
jgi:hypothetical protein